MDDQLQSLLATTVHESFATPPKIKQIRQYHSKQKEDDLETGLQPLSTKFTTITRRLHYLQQSMIRHKYVNIESAAGEIDRLKLHLENASAQACHDIKLANETLDELKTKNRLFFVLLVVLCVYNLFQGVWYLFPGLRSFLL